jgi:hypothetical protein
MMAVSISAMFCPGLLLEPKMRLKKYSVGAHMQGTSVGKWAHLQGRYELRRGRE